MDKYDQTRGSHSEAMRWYVFWPRMYIYNFLFNNHFRFGPDFTFTRPGLEMKYACIAANKVGANLNFLGSEFNKTTWQRLYHETRFNLPHYIMKRW